MRYRYKVRTPKGDSFSGAIEAPSPELVVEILHRRNFIVTDIEEIDRAPFYKRKIRILPERIKSKDLLFLFKQLSNLFSAGVPLIESLNAISKQTSNNLLRQVLGEIISDIEGGFSFSKAIGRHSKFFSSFIVNMVKTGEAVGNLENVLKHLADHIEKEYALVSKIKGAMIYPAFILCAAVGVVAVMLVFVMPKMSGMLKEFGAELPLPTKILLFLSDSLTQFGVIFVIAIPLLVVVFRKYAKTKTGERLKSKLEIKLPVIGQLFRNIYLSRMSENLGTLVKGGIPIVQSLDIVAGVIGNALYREVLEKSQEAVKKGESISESIGRFEIIPPIFFQMISSGEKTGKIHETLIEMSKFFNEEVNVMVNNLMSLLEPVLIVSLGFVAAFIAAAVLLPIYQLAGSM